MNDQILHKTARIQHQLGLKYRGQRLILYLGRIQEKQLLSAVVHLFKPGQTTDTTNLDGGKFSGMTVVVVKREDYLAVHPE